MAKKKTAEKPKATRKRKPKAEAVEREVVTLSCQGKLIEQDAPQEEGE